MFNDAQYFYVLTVLFFSIFPVNIFVVSLLFNKADHGNFDFFNKVCKSYSIHLSNFGMKLLSNNHE